MVTLEEIEAATKDFDPSVYSNLDDEWRRLIGGFNYYRWLWAVVKLTQPKYVVEIGRERGVSASVMLNALPQDGWLDSIDINLESIFLDNGFHDVRLSLITSDSLMAEKVLRYQPIDFLFIDGDHTGDHVAKEWELYKPHLAPNAIVAFDDIHFNEGMTNFWNSIEEEKYDITKWHERGFGVVFMSR